MVSRPCAYMYVNICCLACVHTLIFLLVAGSDTCTCIAGRGGINGDIIF